MTLDLSKIASSIDNMVSDLADSNRAFATATGVALKKLALSSGMTELNNKISQSKTSWLIGEPVNGLDVRLSAPPVPQEFSVIATDGSQIDVDRHQSVRCYLLNIGIVLLKYGLQPHALLESLPILYSNNDDLLLKPPDGAPGREVPVEGALLGIKRTVEEFRRLAILSQQIPEGSKALAMIDGSLIMWPLASKEFPDFVIVQMLHEGILNSMNQIKDINPSADIALASYISYPRSTDVINTLRIIMCPHHLPDCDKYCSLISKPERPCDVLSNIRDRDLFWQFLNENERSGLFISQSKISKTHYNSNRVYFYYLKTKEEISRIEVPEWVAVNNALLNLSHSIIINQCHKGHGYPVALSEAHEQAVVSGADRESFYRLVDEYLAKNNLMRNHSIKSLSKKTRWV